MRRLLGAALSGPARLQAQPGIDATTLLAAVSAGYGVGRHAEPDPILAGKVRYFADPEFQGLFDRPDASALSPAQPVPVAAE